MKKIIVLIAGFLMLFSASQASVAAPDSSQDGGEKVIQAKLMSKQTTSTPDGMLAVYTADVKTGEMTFEGFEPDNGKHKLGAVSDAESSDFAAAISGPYVPARTGNFALWSNSPFYNSIGFSGAGVKDGNWTNRNYATTGNWTGGFNWVYGGRTYSSAVLGPSSRINLTNTATIVRVSLQ